VGEARAAAGSGNGDRVASGQLQRPLLRVHRRFPDRRSHWRLQPLRLQLRRQSERIAGCRSRRRRPC
jgi:hypothetical protein